MIDRNHFAGVRLVPLLDARQSRLADGFTIRQRHTPGSVLMERAGEATTNVLLKILKENNPKESPIVIVCGGGNNGGDGWVVGRKLWEQGIRALVLTLKKPDELVGDAKNVSRAVFGAFFRSF